MLGSNYMSDEEEFLRFVVPTVRSILRIVCVSIIYLSLLLALGAGLLKSAVAACIAFVLLSIGLGRVVLERLALWSVVLLMVDWTGLLPLKEWGHAIIGIINRGLA
jgi:hypothetical protein